MVALQVYKNSVNGVMDGVSTFYDSSYNDGIDLDDTGKIRNPLENCAIVRSKLLAVEKRRNYDTIPFIIWNIDTSLHELRFFITNVPKAVFLEDMLLHRLIPVQTGSVYSFNAIETDTLKRFRIVFCNLLAINTINQEPRVVEIKNLILYPNPAKDYLNIKGLPAGSYTITIIGSQKKQTFNIIHTSNNPEQIKFSLPAGYYRAIIEDGKALRIVKSFLTY